MLITKIILKENFEETLDGGDLVIFKNPVEQDDVFKVIDLIKQSKPDEYTAEDIYTAMKIIFPVENIIWLDDITIISY